MTTFDYNYQNSFRFCFVIEICQSRWGLKNNSPNLQKKTTNWRILVVVVKWRHRAIVLLMNTIIANFWHVNAFSGMMRVLIYFSKLTFYLCGTKNPPIKHPYFVLKSYQSPTFLVLCSYFSYKLFCKMAGPYGLWAPTWRPEINRNIC